MIKRGDLSTFKFWQKNDKRRVKQVVSRCYNCNAKFEHAPSKKKKYCSPACQDECIGGPVPVRLDRLIERDDTGKGCWLWKGSANHGGYGTISIDGRTRLAHRVAYETYVGPIPKGMFILHICDNPPCCNPSHHRIGSHEENMRDMAEKNRGSKTKTTWMTRVKMVKDVRNGDSVEEVAQRYEVSKGSVRRWVEKFASGDVFGYDQLLDEDDNATH